jgi:16S rRNA (guanine966-N2)-methyltransferase
VRIIAGDYRGRRIPVPQKPDLRPTPDRVRETLFNWLGQWLDGLVCLDLFAGSGALGFEAASRGAARVMVGIPAVFESLEKPRPDRREVDRAGAATPSSIWAFARFDVVFPRPPFRQRRPFRCRGRARNARVYVEASEPFTPGAPWHEVKCARAGQVSYQLFEWRSDDQGGLPRNV